jgi:integrase
MAPASVRRIHGILSPALGYAVSWNWIDRNPAEHAHPPKLKRRRAKPPAEEKVARLLNLAWATSVDFAMYLWLATTTGARRGELTGVRWTEVNLRAGIISIEKNYVQRGGQSELKETKTDTDRRLSLDPLTVQMLTDFHAQLEARLAPAHLTLAKDAYVFSPDPLGLRPWHPDHFSHEFRKLADFVEIAEPLKNLRQFNATQLLSAGVDLRTTAGRLGHSDGGATTLKIYADWMPATDRKAAERLATTSQAACHRGRTSMAMGCRCWAAIQVSVTVRPRGE